MGAHDDLAERLQALLQEFCATHSCEIVFLALVPPLIARSVGLEQASVPVEVRVVRRGGGGESLPGV